MKKGISLLLAALLLLQTLACIRIEFGSGASSKKGPLPTEKTSAAQTAPPTAAPTPTASPTPTPVPTASPTPELPPMEALRAAIEALEAQKTLRLDCEGQFSLGVWAADGMPPISYVFSIRLGLDYQVDPMRMNGTLSVNMPL